MGVMNRNGALHSVQVCKGRGACRKKGHAERRACRKRVMQFEGHALKGACRKREKQKEGQAERGGMQKEGHAERGGMQKEGHAGRACPEMGEARRRE